MCCCQHTCHKCNSDKAESTANAFKLKYRITEAQEKQIVQLGDLMPPLPSENAEKWLDRLYRVWYAANT